MTRGVRDDVPATGDGSPGAGLTGGGVLRLRREIGEVIVIPSIDCELHVLDVDDDGVVLLGFDAPRGVEIVRRELHVARRRALGKRVTGDRDAAPLDESS